MLLKIVLYYNFFIEIMIFVCEVFWSIYENKMYKKLLNVKKNLFWLIDLLDCILFWLYFVRYVFWFWKFLVVFF